MEEDDIVRESNLDSVRGITHKAARRVISVSLLSGFLAGLLFAGLVYLFTNPSQLWLAVACIAIFSSLGVYEAVKWQRHYRSIDQQLDAIEVRVRNGETIYASQVKFKSPG